MTKRMMEVESCEEHRKCRDAFERGLVGCPVEDPDEYGDWVTRGEGVHPDCPLPPIAKPDIDKAAKACAEAVDKTFGRPQGGPKREAIIKAALLSLALLQPTVDVLEKIREEIFNLAPIDDSEINVEDALDILDKHIKHHKKGGE